MTTQTKAIELRNHTWHTEPKEWGNHNNGGDYAFGTEEIWVDGECIGTIQTTSSQFPYCQIRGTFTECATVEIEGSGINILISEELVRDHDGGIPENVSLEELKNML